MKLSTNSRYGLRAMVELAANCDGGPVALRQIAARQNISESYLEQAFATLRRAGLIKSVKGPQGGYFLAHSPESLKAGAILRALEGGLSIVDDSQVYTGDETVKRCIKKYVWDAVDAGVARALDSVTLAELAGEYRRMRGNAQTNNI